MRPAFPDVLSMSLQVRHGSDWHQKFPVTHPSLQVLMWEVAAWQYQELLCKTEVSC